MNPTTRHIVIAAVLVTALAGCARTTEGASAEDTAKSSAEATATTHSASSSPVGSSTATSEEFTLPAYGVEPTTTRALAPGEVTCEPDAATSSTVDATGAAPGSPTAIVAVPDGFTSAPGTGDTALTMTGPDGLTATVTITPTTLDAAAAFQQYADQRTAQATITSVSVLPADLCGYSGQKLMGILADKPGEGIDYEDRIVHVWTGAGDYLIAIQVQGPNGAPGLDDATSVALADFGIRMP